MKIFENIQMMKYMTRPASGEKAGRPTMPATKAQEKIAQSVYQKPFSDLNKDQRYKIRTGQTTLKSGESKLNLMTNEQRTQLTNQRLKDFVADFKIKNERLPSVTEIRNLGNFDYDTVRKAVNKNVIEAQKLGASRGLTDPKVLAVNKDLLKLNKNKQFIADISKGKFPDLNVVAKVLNTDKNIAANRVYQFASALTGDRVVEGIQPRFKQAAENLLETKGVYGPQLRAEAEIKIGKSVGEKSIKGIRKQVVRQYPEDFPAAKYAVDEPAGVMSSARLKSTPYGIFSQIIETDINFPAKYEFDRMKSMKEKKLQEVIKKGNNIEVKKAVNDFNDMVSKYERKLNASVKAGEPKIRLFKVSLDSPESTIANFKNLPETYQESFMKNYATRGYSFKVPSDIKTMPQIAEELKDVKNLETLSKGAKAGQARVYAEAVPGSRYLGEFLSGFVDDLAKRRLGTAGFKSLGLAGAAYGIYDTGVAFNEGKSVPEMVTRFFGLDPLYQKANQFYRLSPEEQDIQKRVNAQESFQAAQFDAMDEGLMSMTTPPKISEPEKLKLQQAKQRVENEIQQEEAKAAAGRKGLVDRAKEFFYKITGTPYAAYYSGGGRVYFSEGGKPKDIGRRKFIGLGLKLAAAIPFLGHLVKPVAKVAPEAINAISRSASEIPTYLSDLISKVKTLGSSKLLGRIDDPDGYVKYSLGDYEVTEAANATRVKRINDKGDFGYNEYEMELRKDPETGALEYEEVTASPDYEGKIKDIDFGIDDTIHEDMKKFTYED